MIQDKTYHMSADAAINQRGLYLPPVSHAKTNMGVLNREHLPPAVAEIRQLNVQDILTYRQCRDIIGILQKFGICRTTLPNTIWQLPNLTVLVCRVSLGFDSAIGLVLIAGYADIQGAADRNRAVQRLDL